MNHLGRVLQNQFGQMQDMQDHSASVLHDHVGPFGFGFAFQ